MKPDVFSISNQNPECSVCWYCHSQITCDNIDPMVLEFYCSNHKPLSIKWTYSNLDGEWTLSYIHVYIPKHFELYWYRKYSYFKLYEWSKEDRLWDVRIKQTFSVDWVLSQNPERLLSLLQMYKTFS